MVALVPATGLPLNICGEPVVVESSVLYRMSYPVAPLTPVQSTSICVSPAVKEGAEAGREGDINAFAADVDSDQRMEIDRMRALLGSR